jgi:hypothetical protein
MVVQGVPPTGAHRRGASQTQPPIEVGQKSPAAPSLDVCAPAPYVGSGVASPGDSTNQTPCSEVDAMQGRTIGKGSPTYEQ